MNEHEHIQSGLIGAGFWAKCGKVYAGGYRTERGAINAVKRKLDALQKLAQIRQEYREASHLNISATNTATT